MSAIFWTLIILAVIYLTYYLGKYQIFNTVKIKSSVDGQEYSVHTYNGSDLAQESANMLAIINNKAIILMKHLKRTYPKDPKVINLLKRYNPDNLVENSPSDIFGDTSYSINKGSLLAMCIRSKDDNEKGKNPIIHDEQLVTFVMIHELAHLTIEEYNHPDPFWIAFRFLLIESEKIGIYTNVDYSLYPIVYCGLKVDYNPVFDPNL
jgi:hypothetical protein